MKRSINLVILSALLSLAACGGGSGGGAGKPPEPLPTLAAAVDAYAQSSMAAVGASAASVSIMKGGEPLYEKSYGTPTHPLFRTASVIKPVTAAVVQQLATAGRLALTDHAFCTGDNVPCWLAPALLPAGHDARVREITIGQLIDHKGGWNREVSGDPAAMETVIRDALGLQRPPTRAEIIRYIMARPLDFAPGAQRSYANFGYLLLGEIIEQASQAHYIDYAYERIMAPLGIAAADFKVAHTRLAERDPREPVYLSTLMAPSVYVPGTMALAMNEGAEGGNWVPVASTLITAHALARFAGMHRIPDGVPLAGSTNAAMHNGIVPGGSTLVRQLKSGTSYALFINTSIPDASYDILVRDIDAMLAARGY